MVQAPGKLRLLLWYWGRRGVPRLTLELARALAAREDVALSLSLSRQSELFAETEALGVPGWHVDTFTGKLSVVARSAALPLLAWRFRRFLAAAQIEAVLCPMSHVWNPAVAWAIRRQRATYMLAIHDATHHPGDESWLGLRLMRADIAAADLIATFSRFAQERVEAVHKVARERIVAVPFPVIGYAKTEAPQAARVLPAARPLRLLFFGRILAYKGLDILLDALDLLSRDGMRPTLRIAGEGLLDPFQARLKAMDAAIDNRWIGEDEIAGFFAWADIVVLPYREASQSGVVPIALAAGLPVVATSVGALAEQIATEVSGLLVPPEDPAALAAALRRLAEEPGLYRRLSEGALAAAAQSSWAGVADRLVTALKAARSQFPARA